MSQKPASSRPLPPPTRVSNGVPWWLWLLIGGFGVFVGITLVKKAIPDDPKLLVKEGFDALEKGDVTAVERNIGKLKQYPEHAADQKLMEGMMYIGKSKPLLAVPLLREAANDPKVRSKAMVQLGSALTRSRQRLEAIEVFETVLKEDESADDARLNLAYLFKDMISWDIALQHLLVLKEHGHKLGSVHQMLADIYFDMGKFADAATEYKAAIEAEPTSPANSSKAARLLKCKMETGEFEGAEEYVSLVDAGGLRDSFRALKLAQDGETEEALSTLEHFLHEMPNDMTANITNAQILAKLDSKDRAVAGLTMLREPASYMTRNLKMFEAVAKLGVTAERPELTITAQKNADQLRDLEAQFAAKLGEVIKTRDNAQSRIELGDLAAAAGNPEVARTIYLAATYIDKAFEPAVEEKMQALYQPLPMLVPLVQLDGAGNIEPPATETAPETSPTPESAPKDEPTDAPKEEAKNDSVPEATPEQKADTPSEPRADATGEPKADGAAPEPNADAPAKPMPETTPEPEPK